MDELKAGEGEVKRHAAIYIYGADDEQVKKVAEYARFMGLDCEVVLDEPDE